MLKIANAYFVTVVLGILCIATILVDSMLLNRGRLASSP